MRTITKAALSTFVLTPALALGTATSAAAAPGVRVSPAGSAGALSASCWANSVCFWTKKNFKGTKYTFTGRPGACASTPGGRVVRVRSLITGRHRGLANMYTGTGCRGHKAHGYPRNAGFPSLGGFAMRSAK